MGGKKRTVVAAMVACGVLAGCMGENETAGAALGGIVGGLAGNQFGKGDGKVAATAAGAAIGALAGAQVGRSLDEQSRSAAQRAAVQSLESGQTITWDNPQNAAGPASGQTTIVRSGRAADGRTCREYQTTVRIGGELQKSYGTACRDAAGQWQIIS